MRVPSRWLLPLIAACAAPVLAQDTPQVPKIQVPKIGPAPLKASDGKEATPGRVPSDAGPAATALWNEMLKATKASETTQPIRSFSMGFDVRMRDIGEANFPTKDIKAIFDYLDLGKGYVRGTYSQSGRMMMRGPNGDWSVTEKGGPVALRGREDATSRAELDRLIAICRNFVALTRPSEIRLVELRALKLAKANPDVTEPLDARTLEFDRGRFLRMPNDKLDAPARKLRWLEVASPDFRLYVPPTEATSSGTEPVYRALLGLNERGQVRFAQFSQDKDGTLLPSTALFVNTIQHTEIDDYVLPLELEVHTVQHDSGVWRFEEKPSVMLYAMRHLSEINPVFPKGHFVPAE